MAWGTLLNRNGEAQPGLSATIKNLDGTNATTWSAVTGGSSSTSSLTSDSNGNLPSFIEGGQYTLDVSALGVTGRRVEAVSGSVESGVGLVRVADPTGVLATDTAAITAAVTAADGEPVYLAPGDYAVDLSFTDQDIHLTGPGRLVHQQGSTALKVERTLGTSRSVTSIATLQLGANNNVLTETQSQINAAQADLADVVQGDLFLLSSQDAYSAPAYVSGGANTYKTSWVPVHGLGLLIDGLSNGGPVEGDVIVGAGGATATCLSVSPRQGGTEVCAIFGSFTGTWVDNENVTVAGQARGVVNGTPFIIMAGKLLDTHSTTVVMRKADRTPTCIIDVDLVASGNPDDKSILTVNRLPAIQLRGVVDAKVKATIETAWTRAVQLSCCYAADVDVTVHKLPNDANLTIEGYGYGVELMGATEMSRIKVIARNLRHGFTTNTTSNSSYAFVDLLASGVPKYNTIHDSIAYDPITSGFDTHPGAYFTTFENCKTIRGASGYRTTATNWGFHNRAFGTTFDGCKAIGCQTGFYDETIQYTSPFTNMIRYVDCVAQDYGLNGFNQAQSSSVDALTRIEYVDCEAMGDGSTLNAPHFQVGFNNAAGGNIIWNGCIARRFTGNPFRVFGGRVTAINCHFDLDGITGAGGFRFDGNPGEANLIGLTYRVNTGSPTNLAGAIRIASAATAVPLRMDAVKALGTSTPRPLFDISAGGAVTVVPLASLDRPGTQTLATDAAFTLTPKQTPRQTFHTGTLTADRAITLSTTDASDGDTFRIARTGSGAFNLTHALKNLATNTWAEFVYDGTGAAWKLGAYGAL